MAHSPGLRLFIVSEIVALDVMMPVMSRWSSASDSAVTHMWLACASLSC